MVDSYILAIFSSFLDPQKFKLETHDLVGNIDIFLRNCEANLFAFCAIAYVYLYKIILYSTLQPEVRSTQVTLQLGISIEQRELSSTLHCLVSMHGFCRIC